MTGKARSYTLFYLVTIGALFGIIFWVLRAGKQLESVSLGMPSPGHSTAAVPDHSIASALSHPLAVFILQLIVIIIAARVFGALFKRLGQPAVMGEIIAGIVLGPSVLGAFLPEATAFLFPDKSLGNLGMLSQVGLILFMFVVGMELDVEVLKKKAGAAVVISHASIVVPFGLGVILAYFMYRDFAPPGIPFYGFALFSGIAMSITAFPVLARILRERQMTQTRLGAIAITCAAADDVTAWCLLALIITVVRAGSVAGSLYILVPAVAITAVMLFAVKPLLQRLPRRETGAMRHSTLAIVLIVMLASAWACEVIGVHALFGAFLAGVVMPMDEEFRSQLTGKIEDVALVLLLPLFFVFTGLRTQVGLLNTPGLWLVCLLVTTVAIAGKFGGSALAARFTGETWKNSLSIGFLMNTRGLMELVVLNIGYDLGILTPQVFAMMVIMAIVTTMMTSPGLNIINRLYRER